jgi:hypothetical protein
MTVRDAAQPDRRSTSGALWNPILMALNALHVSSRFWQRAEAPERAGVDPPRLCARGHPPAPNGGVNLARRALAANDAGSSTRRKLAHFVLVGQRVAADGRENHRGFVETVPGCS